MNRKSKFNKESSLVPAVFLLLLWILVGYLVTPGQSRLEFSYTNNGTTYHPVLMNRFEQYRQDAIDVILEHLKQHPDCQLQAISLTRMMDVKFFYFDWSSTARRMGYLLSGDIGINKNLHWKDRKESVACLVHEFIHMARICGPDAPDRPIKDTSCILFGSPMRESLEIQDAVEYHLRKELARLKKK